MSDTIFAEATAGGKAGVAIIRISGPAAFDAVSRIAGPLPRLRQAGLRDIRGHAGQLIDTGLVLLFPKGASFTGEDIAELQLHGSRAIVAAVLSELSGIEGLRTAEPGEFTRRAMESGRLDLTQVEGLADLIEAETEVQRHQAMRVFGGELAELAAGWRSELLRASGLLTASIDFADEDVPEDVSREVGEIVRSVRQSIDAEMARSVFSERIRNGFEVAIVGPPNAGKSTLLNRLSGRDAAITSDVPGTTRDPIEVRMDLSGIAVTLIDTAGLRDTTDLVEAEGVRRATDRLRRADLRVFLDMVAKDIGPDDILVTNKSDLGVSGPGFSISAKTGAGVDELVVEIAKRLRSKVSLSGSVIRQRHREVLSSLCETLDVATKMVENHDEPVLVSEEIRFGLRRLDGLAGVSGVEDILDVVFSSFCIGK